MDLPPSQLGIQIINTVRIRLVQNSRLHSSSSESHTYFQVSPLVGISITHLPSSLSGPPTTYYLHAHAIPQPPYAQRRPSPSPTPSRPFQTIYLDAGPLPFFFAPYPLSDAILFFFFFAQHTHYPMCYSLNTHMIRQCASLHLQLCFSRSSPTSASKQVNYAATQLGVCMYVCILWLTFLFSLNITHCPSRTASSYKKR